MTDMISMSLFLHLYIGTSYKFFYVNESSFIMLSSNAHNNETSFIEKITMYPFLDLVCDAMYTCALLFIYFTIL